MNAIRIVQAQPQARGFTLIEVMMVVAILAILAAISYPSYMEQVRKSWRSEARTALMQQMQHQERHYTQVGRYRRYVGDSGESGATGKYLIESGNCEGRSNIDSCIRLTASPKPDYADPHFGMFWLDSTGGRGCDGAQRVKCWQ
ncbi:type IV pilin protein [Variovorax paradoxus]|uniref:Fimbrial protein n=1 Tax=Variovorax paradoxus TaxID=34073 RepID=A0A679J8L6_VARPD|nr:Fimbrial protein [Variovorax paradoxus]